MFIINILISRSYFILFPEVKVHARIHFRLQLIRERLSEKRTKVHATRPTGSMGTGYAGFKKNFETQRYATEKEKLQKEATWEEKQNLHVQKYKLVHANLNEYPDHLSVLSRAILFFFPTNLSRIRCIQLFIRFVRQLRYSLESISVAR